MATRTRFVGAERFVPARPTITSMARAVQKCKGCPLYKPATQAVFGEGPARAKMLLVGEQPGNDEDLDGHPFVGPAGRVLDEALDRAGIRRESVYVTNIVKHFKFERAGKRRLHKRPTVSEVNACKPWFEHELARIRPDVVVLLGATAAQGVLGREFQVTKMRGRAFRDLKFAAVVIATAHPSAVLRQRTSEERAAAKAQLIADLVLARKALSLTKPTKPARSEFQR